MKGKFSLKVQSGRLGINRRVKTLFISLLLVSIIFGVYVAGMIIGNDALAVDFSRKGLPPSRAYPFGTDWLGRDMLQRTVKGLSLSIMIGIVASGVSAILATIVGVVAAMSSGWVDSIINWIIDLVMGVPHLVLLILISFSMGRGLLGLLVGIAVTHWTGLARLVRAEVLQIKNKQYIKISKSLGHSSLWILVNHILPHMVPQFIIGIVLLFPHAILHESSLSFLGFGLPPEQPAVGIILAESMKYLMGGMWWLAFFPGITLVLIVVMFDKLGENLKILFDPYSAHE